MGIRVVLVDDQQLVRTGFRLILEMEPDIDVVGEADDGRQGVELARSLRPDVVLMDIRMPEMDGVEATRLLAAPQVGGPRVLILTTYDADEYVVEGLRAGASGFLLKDAPPQQLVDAVRVISAGEALLAPSVTRRLLDRFAGRLGPTRTATDVLRELTDRELDVLRLVARGLSNAEIAHELTVTTPTVKTHVSHILDKLRLRDRAQAVVVAFDVGLVEPGSSREGDRSGAHPRGGVDIPPRD
jgi:DNA-binding NarL/FixJ family response regulator